jgi:putative transcriptional regulator
MNIDKIAKAIEADAGMALPDLKDSLAEMQQGLSARIHTPEQLLLRSARQKTGKTQQAFAELIKTPVATLRDWEQGRFSPSGAVLCLLHLISNHPDMIDELAHIEYSHHR